MKHLKDKTVALIDADSLIYIIGYNHQESTDTDSVKNACKSMLDMIMDTCRASHYLGVFSGENCFRDEHYKVRRYKGNRKGDKPDWFYTWEPVIKKVFTDDYNFITINELEADDVVIAANHYLRTEMSRPVICTPDKDLKQVAGTFFDYKKAELSEVSVEEAYMNLLTQYLTGDTTDNIAGVPKIGPVKAADILKQNDDGAIGMEMAVLAQYLHYYGPHYGKLIYDETVDTVKMIQPGHTFWFKYKHVIFEAIKNHFMFINNYEFE